MLLVSLFSGFYIGMCTYIDTCVQDLANYALDVDKIIESEKSIENERKFVDTCSDMLRFHIDILE